jgi:hypothetical protein
VPQEPEIRVDDLVKGFQISIAQLRSAGKTSRLAFVCAPASINSNGPIRSARTLSESLTSGQLPVDIRAGVLARGANGFQMYTFAELDRCLKTGHQ